MLISFLYILFLLLPQKKIVISTAISENESINFSLKKPEKNILQIQNNGEKLCQFKLELNNKIFEDKTSIVSYILNMPPLFKGEPIEQKTWRFVANQLQRQQPFSSENWQHDPMIMINSLGYGICDDYASVLAYLWKEMSFNSRIWGLEGHVVSEVYVKESWQMYDADFAVYFRINKQEVASVDTLSKTTTLYNNIVKTENGKDYIRDFMLNSDLIN